LAALKYFLEEIAGKDKVSLLVFAQDTILLNNILRREEEENYFRAGQVNVLKRIDLYNKLYRELYKANVNVAKDLGVAKSSDYKKFVRFIPGVISTKIGGKIYTWRGDNIHEIISGVIAVNIYKELIEKAGATRKISLVVDTTHGINYLVSAFIEGLTIGAIIYALHRMSEGSELEELTIYHYNSDPIKRTKYTPSLKLHLLHEIPLAENYRINIAPLTSFIEGRVMLERLDGLVSKLRDFWSIDGDTWLKALVTLLLFARGIIT